MPSVLVGSRTSGNRRGYEKPAEVRCESSGSRSSWEKNRVGGDSWCKKKEERGAGEEEIGQSENGRQVKVNLGSRVRPVGDP